MRIPRRTVSIGSLSLAALALGGVLFAQNTPDKSADNTAGRNAEPVYRVGKGVSLPRPIYTPSLELSQEAKEAKYQATVRRMAIVFGGGDVPTRRPLMPWEWALTRGISRSSTTMEVQASN
jgi:hypothetical protein